MTVGLGSGSTAALMVRRLAERIEQERLKIHRGRDQLATAELACSLKIAIAELDDVAISTSISTAPTRSTPITDDQGAGRGLATREDRRRLPDHRVTMITADKRVERLGMIVPIPVEVSPIGVKHTERRLQQLGAAQRSGTLPTVLPI